MTKAVQLLTIPLAIFLAVRIPAPSETVTYALVGAFFLLLGLAAEIHADMQGAKQ
jgi:hypothetical protein